MNLTGANSENRIQWGKKPIMDSRQRQAKKHLLLLWIVLLSLPVLLCSGCERQRYQDADAEAITQRGREFV